MWIKSLVVVAFVATLAFAQEEVEGGPSPAEDDVEAGPSADADAQGEAVGVRKFRLRRPRPKIIGIENEDGIAQGNPVPLRAGVPVDQLINRQKSTADLLAAAVDAPQNNALQNLLETASEGSGLEEESQPILPLRQQPVDQPRRQNAPRRRVPGVPRRAQGSRARPRPQQESDEEGGNGRPRPEPVKTTERYSHMNPDGSFTFGYVSEDGSFREETRGLDCITRGKYGYIDPEGKRREFTYVSGLPCDSEEEQQFDDQGFAIEDDENAIQQDPIDPADRFRQSQAVQLADDEIPDSARPSPQRRPVQRRPQPQFNNFQGAQQPARQQRPRARPTAAAPRPTQGGNALQNLFSIADGNAAPQPSPTPVVTRPRPTPTRARPTANSRPNFDFDTEVDSFTLNKPALTFNQERPRSQSGTPAPANQAVGPNFSSELVFDPASGTFKTELRQAIPGQPDISIKDSAQPGARRPQPTQGPTPRPTPTAAFAATTRRPTPAGNPTQFSPLSFPDPATVQRPASPSPSPVPSPTPRPTTPVRPPTPTRPAVTTPRPPTTPVRPAGPTNPANSFFFQPFPTVGSPRPVAPGQAATTIRPPTIIPAGTFNLNAGRPAPQAPQPPQVPGFPRPTPVVQAGPTAAAAPTRAAPPTAVQPQLQFGFSPIPQNRPVPSVQGVPRPQQPQGARPVPFTAFRNGLPQQLQGQPRPQFVQQGRPQQPFQAFAPRPQQPQARPPQGFAVRPPPQGFQQRPEQFRTAGPPPARFQGRPAAPPAGFSVFNPAALRGARF
jgi:hypothetical protein